MPPGSSNFPRGEFDDTVLYGEPISEAPAEFGESVQNGEFNSDTPGSLGSSQFSFTPTS